MSYLLPWCWGWGCARKTSLSPPPPPVNHYWLFQCDSFVVVHGCLFLASEFRLRFTLRVFILFLVRFRLLSGHLLGNSCSHGWPYVLFVFWLFVILYSYFPFWFWGLDLGSNSFSSWSYNAFFFTVLMYILFLGIWLEYMKRVWSQQKPKIKNCLFAASSCPAILGSTQNILLPQSQNLFLIILVDFILQCRNISKTNKNCEINKKQIFHWFT